MARKKRKAKEDSEEEPDEDIEEQPESEEEEEEEEVKVKKKKKKSKKDKKKSKKKDKKKEKKEKKAKPAKKKRKVESSEEEEEEFEEEEEEEEFEEEEEEEEFEEEEEEESADDEYDEEYIGDEDDRARLNRMTEIEREGIIYERTVARKEKQDRREAKRRMAGHKKQARQSSRRKDTGRQSSRAKSKADSALADIAARQSRRQSGKQSDEFNLEESDTDDDGQRRRGVSDVDSNEEEENLDDQSGDDSDDKPKKKVGTTKLRYTDIKKIQMRRTALEKTFNEPYFPTIVKGMFVRVVIGQREDGESAYRMCEITDVVDYKMEYMFGGCKTKAALQMKHGKAERVFQMMLVSNQSITHEEFSRWEKEMNRCDIAILSSEDALMRKKNAEYTRQNFSYTADVVTEVLEKVRKAKKADQINFTFDKSNISHRMAQAKEDGDSETVDRLTAELEALSEREAGARRKELSTQNKGRQGLILMNSRKRKLNTQLHDKLHLNINKREVGERKTGIIEDFDPYLTKRTLAKAPWLNAEAHAQREKDFKEEQDNFEAKKKQRRDAQKVVRKPKAPKFTLLDDLTDLQLEADLATKARSVSSTAEFNFLSVSPSDHTAKQVAQWHTKILLNIDLGAAPPAKAAAPVGIRMPEPNQQYEKTFGLQAYLKMMEEAEMAEGTETAQ